ncbi:hypothetical protein [Candidatus Poriferisocius sp.]|uniref:hypothetical protein n=1 Tax=Candidatus Poriferisocius sp. TaxID=3101276 RepID=UPI003B01FEBC
MTPRYRNPQAEADAIVGEGLTTRVLEPSPPADVTGPWYADDPAAVGNREQTTARVVTPTSAGDLRWADLAAADETVADFCRPRWLANYQPLVGVPDHYPVRRDDLHRLAYGVVSNTRKAANGKFGLRWTLGGFGTPFFGDDIQVRVEGRLLVRQHGDRVEAETITTLAAAADFLGVEATSDQAEHDTVALGDLDRPLTVDEELVAFIGDWFGMATAALEELRCTPGAPDPSRVQLWPGHFDLAVEIGEAESEPVTRATYGASPGDAAHPEPYLYVGPWGPIDHGDPFWNDTAFTGASLPYAAIEGDPNPCGVALGFYRQALSRLTGL